LASIISVLFACPMNAEDPAHDPSSVEVVAGCWPQNGSRQPEAG